MHDQVLDIVDLDLVARVLAVEDAVPRLDVHGQDLAVLGHLAFAHGDDFALLGLFLGGVGDDDPAPLGFLRSRPA